MPEERRKGGGHGKSTKKPKIAKRKRSWERCHFIKKDRRVLLSSKGHFTSVAQLEAHRIKVTKKGKQQ